MQRIYYYRFTFDTNHNFVCTFLVRCVNMVNGNIQKFNGKMNVFVQRYRRFDRCATNVRLITSPLLRCDPTEFRTNCHQYMRPCKFARHHRFSTTIENILYVCIWFVCICVCVLTNRLPFDLVCHTDCRGHFKSIARPTNKCIATKKRNTIISKYKIGEKTFITLIKF